MFFHEIAQELKTYMDPAGRGGFFVQKLVGDLLRDPMTDEEDMEKYLHEYNPMEKNISENMLDQIYGGSKFISRDRARRICSKYDGMAFADEIASLYPVERDMSARLAYVQ